MTRAVALVFAAAALVATSSSAGRAVAAAQRSIVVGWAGCGAPGIARQLERGLLLYDAYNGPAAERVFRDASRAAPRCAAAWWGIALAAGPNLNFPITASGFARAAAAVRSAVELRGEATPEQRALIDATSLRYAGVFADYPGNEQRYVSALRRSVAARGQGADDLALLLCEALLEERNGPAVWSKAGAAEREEVTKLLAGVLSRDQAHPMANHLAIHFHDYDPNRAAALPAANRLAAMRFEPDAEHLVHMSAHAYVRAGRYGEALHASEKALLLDRRARFPLYVTHDYFVGLGAAFMGSDYARAADFVRRFCRVRAEGCRELKIETAARFGRWNEVLSATRGRGDPFSLLLRSRALLAADRTSEAEASYAVLRRVAPPLATGANDTTVAFAIARSDPRSAVALALRAAAEPDREPPEFLPLFPPFEILGRAYLAAHERTRAAAAFRAELRSHPCSVRAAAGLRAASPGASVSFAYCRTPLRFADGSIPKVSDL